MMGMAVSSGLVTASQPRPAYDSFSVAAPRLVRPTWSIDGERIERMPRTEEEAPAEKTTRAPN